MSALRRARSIQYSREDQMIYANAIVDVINEPDGVKLGLYRVEVWGREPHDYTRVYSISAKDDNMAAREGLDAFVKEISELLDSQKD